MYYELARQPIRIYINLLQWHNWKKNDQNFITFDCCYNIWSINNNRYKIMLYTSLYRLGNNLMRCRPHNIHPTPHPLTPPSPPAQGSTLIFKVTCPFGQVRFEIHLSCMRCHLSTNPNPCRNMAIVQFCATIFDFSPVPSDKWHCKTTCPRSHFQHFYLSWTVGQPLRSSPAASYGVSFKEN